MKSIKYTDKMTYVIFQPLRFYSHKLLHGLYSIYIYIHVHIVLRLCTYISINTQVYYYENHELM